MLDIKWIRENAERFDKDLAKRGMEKTSKILIELDEKRRSMLTQIQELQQLKKQKSKDFGKFKDKNSPEYQTFMNEANELKAKLAKFEAEFDSQDELNDLLIQMPNILDEEVPVGKSEDDNQQIREFGEIPKFNFEPKQHFEIGENLALMDFEQTAKISGSRFVSLSGDLAKLERAIANFMLNIHTEEFGYREYSVPFLVRDEAMFGAGQLPKFAEDSFETTNFYRLIPTSEVALVNLAKDKIFQENQLPKRFVAHSPCFRSEAGSAGRDTRGMIRLHQFTKVELVTIATKEQEEEELQRKTKAAETILQKLNLPYRVMILCSGDIGFHATKTYDLEVWMPGQNKYREISSCSKCGDYQARRIKARYRSENDNKKTTFVTSLNGSGLAVGRTLAAILENYQNEDGSVTIPEVLRPYMNGAELIHIAKEFI